MTQKDNMVAYPEQQRMSRRGFLKFCGAVAGAMGLGPSFIPKIAEALTASTRPPVLWLHLAECTGCTEATLRTTSPWFDELIMDNISLDYHETLMAAAGDDAEHTLTSVAEQYSGAFFCVVEGAVPTADNGIYGMIGGRTMLSIAQEICSKAQAVIACGTCASYGGLPAAFPNPTGAKGVEGALPGLSLPVINVPGCPPNPINIVGVIVDYLLNGELPALDILGRPLFAYGKKVHSKCPNKRDSSRCLKGDGCKGQWTYHNCPIVKFNEGTSFPIQAGHPCIGCSEPDFWDENTPFYG